MEKRNTISEVMLRHHCRIEKLLNIFKENICHNFELMSVSFEKLKWELEKHIFTEEKAVFKFCNPINKEVSATMLNMVKEHDIILEMLNTIKNDLAIKDNLDVSKFQELLLRHKSFEDEILYPELDNKLNKKQKRLIIEKINKIYLS